MVMGIPIFSFSTASFDGMNDITDHPEAVVIFPRSIDVIEWPAGRVAANLHFGSMGLPVPRMVYRRIWKLRRIRE
jgi:hypothetical protein